MGIQTNKIVQSLNYAQSILFNEKYKLSKQKGKEKEIELLETALQQIQILTNEYPK